VINNRARKPCAPGLGGPYGSRWNVTTTGRYTHYKGDACAAPSCDRHLAIPFRIYKWLLLPRTRWWWWWWIVVTTRVARFITVRFVWNGRPVTGPVWKGVVVPETSTQYPRDGRPLMNTSRRRHGFDISYRSGSLFVPSGPLLFG